jgi:hypothetical protein
MRIIIGRIEKDLKWEFGDTGNVPGMWNQTVHQGHRNRPVPLSKGYLGLVSHE